MLDKDLGMVPAITDNPTERAACAREIMSSHASSVRCSGYSVIIVNSQELPSAQTEKLARPIAVSPPAEVSRATKDMLVL